MSDIEPKRSEREFVILSTLLISLVALAIDAMLPALPEIGADLGVEHSNDRQMVISLFVLGLGIGQLIYGPLSDAHGRKPPIVIGLVIFIAGSVLSIVAWNFELMLLGRFLQGLGAAGPRNVVVAMVRDRYQGAAMASIMSVVMAVFILVPVFAPVLGQLFVSYAHWRAIFVVFFLIALTAMIWFMLRQEETLAAEQRRPFSTRQLVQSTLEIVRHPIALGYMVATGCMFGAFLGYLISAQQIYQDIFGLGALFPLYFAILSIAIGIASYANSRLVMRFGMTKLCIQSMILIIVVSSLFLAIILVKPTPPSLWLFMGSFILIFFGIGMVFGNLNAIAMEPLGHVAGTASAVIGSVTTFMSFILGGIIGSLFNGTLIPLLIGFAGLSAIALAIILVAERKRPGT